MIRFSHPDKNPDPESRKLFVKIATAYEVLQYFYDSETLESGLVNPIIYLCV
jgi:DnaJ family protein C protein 25